MNKSRMPAIVAVALAMMLTVLLPACKKDGGMEELAMCPEGTLDGLRMNEVQVLGSHNSYRLKTYLPIFNFLQLAGNLAGIEDVLEWDYTHIPLDQQMGDYAMRSLEIDIYYDPAGGRFYRRAGNGLVGQPVASGIPELQEPGMKVLHVTDLDYMTNYLTFNDALEAVLDWSTRNEGHIPLYILIEFKETEIPISGFADVIPFSIDAKLSAAEEIRDVIPESKMFTPDAMRGSHATLEEAIRADGWPYLAETRGKIIFIGLDSEEVGGLIFGSNGSLTQHGDQVFKIMNDPEADFADIQSLTAMGFMVRTRADSGTYEARSGHVARREMAVASGAQIISTDYYKPDPRHNHQPRKWSNYSVQWPGKAAARSTAACYIFED